MECENIHNGSIPCEDYCIVQKLTRDKDDRLDVGRVWDIVGRQFSKPGRDEEIGRLLTAVSHCIMRMDILFKSLTDFATHSNNHSAIFVDADDLAKPCEEHKLWNCIKEDWVQNIVCKQSVI